MLVIPEIPNNSILGLNYSGVHDSTIAIVSPTGQIIFACALERVSRVKQDGRPPYQLLENLPWNRIAKVAVSTDAHSWIPEDPTSHIHPAPLPVVRENCLSHGSEFYQYLETLPAPKEFVCHELSHVSSAFWLSGFTDSLCLTYDGGMFNCPWFGGIYHANQVQGIAPLDRFAASHYAKITSLYTVVTALLGFTPLKHEGKITGLAAYGRPDSKCYEILERLLYQDYNLMEEVVEWLYPYSASTEPIFYTHLDRSKKLMQRFDGISKEDVAATLQHMTEEHILTILNNAIQKYGQHNHICLAGGLFANVKINQRIKELGFEHIFIAPPMTDDGTALGAALQVASSNPDFFSQKASSMFFGYSFRESDIIASINSFYLKFEKIEAPADVLAEKLAAGAIVAIFQGAMEYGPRALGNRSILSQATQLKIHTELNDKLRRTEFMPFAPLTKFEDAQDLYENLNGAEHTAEFMTITFNCTELMKSQSPAVVHIDGTARPQLVKKENHPLIHEILTCYKAKTGIASIINTSFNVHEEPIVCSPADAIEGFLSAELDFLYFEGGYLLEFQRNKEAALFYLQKKMGETSQKEKRLQAINLELAKRLSTCLTNITKKEEQIQEKEEQIQEKEEQIRLLSNTAEERVQLIIRLDNELKKRN